MKCVKLDLLDSIRFGCQARIAGFGLAPIKLVKVPIRVGYGRGTFNNLEIISTTIRFQTYPSLLEREDQFREVGSGRNTVFADLHVIAADYVVDHLF